MSSPTQTSSAPVDTGKVTGRRTLRFETIDEMMADVDRLVEAERAGRLKRLGNWTLGQTLGHLATWAEYGYTGSPLNPPFFIKWILRLRKQKFLWQPMPAGVKIPGVKGGTLATDPMPTDEPWLASGESWNALRRNRRPILTMFSGNSNTKSPSLLRYDTPSCT